METIDRPPVVRYDIRRGSDQERSEPMLETAPILLGRNRGSVRIHHCLEKLTDFCRYDAFQRYDLVGYRNLSSPNELQPELLTSMNRAMMARSSRGAWKPVLGKPLPVLAAVPTDVDLIRSADDEYLQARELLRACYAALADRKWITDMAASKMLYLKRPKLVAISDSYVRQALEVEDPHPGPSYGRGDLYAARGLAVADAVRGAGRANLESLQASQSALRRLPEQFEMSLARILDVLIWVEMAILAGHSWWGARAVERSWKRVQW